MEDPQSRTEALGLDCVDVAIGSAQFDDVIALGNGKAKRWLGPMPDSGFADRARKGTLLAAVASGQTIGYVMYDLPANQVKIRHLCVVESARRSGAARFLVACVSARHPERRGLEAACRRDYPANSLWPRLGFRPAATRVGRSVGRHPLTIWLLDHGHPDLFTAMAPDGDLAALDHMVFLDLVEKAGTRPEGGESRELRASWLGDYVELCITDEVFHEIDRVDETSHRSTLQTKADGFLNVSRGMLLDETLVSIVALLAPGADPPDHRHVARAASAGTRYLLSRDDRLLRSTQAIEDATGVTVLRPASLIARLDRTRTANRYVPQALRETELIEAAVGADDLTDFTSSLLNNAAGERSHELAGVARSAVAAVDRSHVSHVRDDTGKVRGGVVRSGEGPNLNVSVLRVVGSDRLAIALARQLAFDQRVAAAGKGGAIVRVSDPHLPDSVVNALGQEWYERDENGTWICDVRVGLTDTSVLDPGQPLRAQGAAWERRHWPQKVLGAGIPTFLMSINVAYAEQLLDPRLAARTLLPRQTHLGLGREHVYYRRPRNDAGIESGARILWYVTGSAPSHPRGSVRAVSTVAEVATGTPDRLYQRFARLGVYTQEQVRASADQNGTAMAIRFVDTEALEHPIGLDELHQLFAAEAESFAPPQSPRESANTCSVTSTRDPLAMAPDESALLVSVRPRYAELLLDGAKTVELRRVRPRAAPGTLVLIYASSPTRGLVGTGRVSAIDAAKLDEVWKVHGKETGVTREEYDTYFDGCDTAVAITLSDVRRLQRPRMLAELRHRHHGFRPPQSFRYLSAAQVAAIV